MISFMTYLAGSCIGFGLTLALISGAWDEDLLAWTAINLGDSIWLFTACLLAYLAALSHLKNRLETSAQLEQVAQLDQLSDVLIHVFIGIGVVWTAIGMRNALVSTLSAPESLGGEAAHVLSRLVDGGILLALSTTIVGAIGGYLMRLLKTISIGSHLTAYYQRQSREPVESALNRLGNIERLLEELTATQGRS